MAGEILFSYSHLKTCYVTVRSRTGTIWNGSSFETYSTANYANYVVSAVEQGTASSVYAATFPATIAAGVYSIVAKEQLGGSPAETDPTVATGDEQWNGSATLPLSDLSTSGLVSQNLPVKVYRGQMVQNFPVYLVSSVDHVTPLVSGVVSGQISRDGGLFGPLQSGAFLEVGLGVYSLQALTSGDLAASTVALVFTANQISGGPSDPRVMSILTQRVSGYN